MDLLIFNNKAISSINLILEMFLVCDNCQVQFHQLIIQLGLNYKHDTQPQHKLLTGAFVWYVVVSKAKKFENLDR